MKKLIFSLVFLMIGTAGLMAQDAKCSKSKKSGKCCSSKKSTAAVSTKLNDTKVLSAAKSLAESDENISMRECAVSGTLGFYKKNVCEKSGSVSYDEVEYNTDSKTFVNKSPDEMKDADGGQVINVSGVSDMKTAVKSKKACSTKGAKAKKACCSKGGEKAKSCDKGAKAKSCDKGAKAKSCDKGAKAKSCAKKEN